ncbi:CoF synthetase [Flagellimonas myxillae]|uniref:CoF synthetase n=1 Tax=Flagellimonas myxillae TaxID=2942214 RepID=UPI00201F0AE4|nr:CoF synthetase [Muricauda myxillae]MCL6266244.1 CoF synthetase [Muricauda myxillae]
MIKLLEWFRRTTFWVLDWCKGGNVGRHYREVKYVQNNPRTEKSKQIRQQHLDQLLGHAVNTVPFYFDISEKEAQLERFPVVNKQVVREKFELLRSQPYINKHNHQVLTSGSTGKPFKILHDKNKRDRNTADTIFFAERAGFKIGAKLYYLRLWDKQYKLGKVKSFVQNMHAQSVDDLSEKNIAILLEDFEQSKSHLNLLAYTSALDSICKYLDEHYKRPLDCTTTSAIAVAEGLSPTVKEKMRKYFNVEVVSRYSNSENGILSQQPLNSRSGYFEINTASYHVEILDLNHDRPVKPGEVGRIVITDLFNYSMPLVRYDTGDVGMMEEDPESGSLVFTKVDGRKMDMFTNTKGEYISSHIIHHILQYKGIQQFQFVQEDVGKYVIKLKVLEKLPIRVEDALRNQYLEYFGEDAELKIKYVKDIPLLASGKRKLVINKVAEASKTQTSKPEKKEDSIDFVVSP